MVAARGRVFESGLVPVVGDWVLLEPEAPVIASTLARRTVLARTRPGGSGEAQVLAANVDAAWIVMSLGSDYSPRRLERYLVLARSGGARPVVVLSKADRDPEGLPACLEECQAIAQGAPVHAVSALSGSGMALLQGALVPGETVALLGSSGVGKSTILNHLLGAAAQQTQAVRVGDDKGRHTTTARELFQLPSGALVIDTPGLREVELWIADEGSSFEDIEALAARCRFRDCRHAGEPGCAVAEGADPARLAGYQKLRRERVHQERKQDLHGMLEEKRRLKVLHRARKKRAWEQP
ncbi:MAG: ribosome small subunit-dependent GTPase A [Myxococcota bacterium]